MSSHHIVKDQQEPALYIEKAVSSTDYELISNLLEWSPIVIVNENSLDFALEWNIKIDVVLCSKEKFSLIEEKVIFQFPIETLVCENFKKGVFDYLKEKKHYALNIFEHNFSVENLQNIQKTALKIVFFDNTKSSFYCQEKWEKWLPKNRKIDFLNPHFSHSQITEKDGFYNYENKEGFWVVEYLTN